MARFAFLALTLAASLTAQETLNFSIRGEIRCDNHATDLSDYEVEIRGASHYASDRVPVRRDGSFELPRVATGNYEVLIVTRTGDEIVREVFFLQPNSGPISLQLPATKEQKPGGAVSIAELRHRVPRQAARELASGVKLARKNRTEEALDHFRKAVAIDPDFAAAHYQLGFTFFARHAPDLALSEFEAVVRLRPEMAQAHLNLAVTLLMLGRNGEAEVEARKALAIQRDYPKAEEVLRLCQSRRARLAPSRSRLP